ncbi:MAG: hypothetical protein ACLQIB_45350 [Isosphaeraceae bacterium]
MSKTAAAGTGVTFTAKASGNPTPSVQWEVIAPRTRSWRNIAHATGTSLTVTASRLISGSKYRALFKNALGTAVSSAAALTVDVPPAVTTQPASQVVQPGGPATFRAVATGTPPPSEQWQVSSDGGNTWGKISGALSTTLTISSVSANADGTEYRAVFMNPVGTVTSSAATLSTAALAPKLSPAVRTVWDSLGGPASYLGDPTTGNQYVDSVTGWPRVDFQGGAVFMVPNGNGGTQGVALSTTMLQDWTSNGGASGALGIPVTPPAWAGTLGITTLGIAGQQPTTGGHDGTVAFFKDGLIYNRDGLMTPDVMVYDSTQMGLDTSARYRLQLLDQFTDVNGLVIVDYNIPPGMTLNPNNPIADHPIIDTDDSAWMTGQALAAVSMLGDMDAAALILSGMVNDEWSPAGDLLRYTGNTRAFSGLDPATQIAGCYFAWKFANSVGNQQVEGLAIQVIDKWIDEIYRSNGTLGPGGPKMLLPGLIELDEVAAATGIDQTRQDDVNQLLDEQRLAAVALSLGYVSGAAVLDNSTLYALCDAVEAGLDNADIAALGLPSWLQTDLAQAGLAIPTLDESGLNLMFWENLVMHELAPSAMLNAVTADLANITASYDLPFQWLAGGSAGVAAAESYVQTAGQDAEDYPASSEPTNQYLGNYWWRTDDRGGPGTSDLQVMSWGNGSGSGVPTSNKSNLVIIGTDTSGLLHIRVFDAVGTETLDTNQTKLPSSEAGAVSTLKQQLQSLTSPNNLTPQQKWQFLEQVTSILDQTNAVVPVTTYNRVDYLVMRGLLNLDASVWQNAPFHIGVSVDLSIPQFGSIEVSGYVDSDGTFSLNGSGALSPAGFPLLNATVTVGGNGTSVSGTVSGTLQLPFDIGSLWVTGNLNLNGDGACSLTNSLTAGEALSLGGFTLTSSASASATVTVSNIVAEAWITGDVYLPNVGSCYVTGAVDNLGNFFLSGSDDLSPGGFYLTETSVIVTNTGVSISGQVDLPAVGSCSVQGWVDNLGDFFLTGSDDLYPGGFTLALDPSTSATVTVSNSGAWITGDVYLPYMGSCSVAGFETADGSFELDGTGELSPVGFDLASASVAIYSTGASISGTVSLPNVGSCFVSGFETADGSFELDGTGELSPVGFDLASASVAIYSTGASISGTVSLPKVGSCFVSGFETSDGSFTLQGYTTLNPAGFTIASTSVTVSNSGVWVDGYLSGPGGLWAEVTGSIYTDGGFDLKGDASASLGGDLAGGTASFDLYPDVNGTVYLVIGINAGFTTGFSTSFGDVSLSGSLSGYVWTSDSGFSSASFANNVNVDLTFSAFGYDVETGCDGLSVNSSGFSIGLPDVTFGFYTISFPTIDVNW